MTEEVERPKRKPAHELGQILDELSVHDLEERIAALHVEIERLQSAMARKQGALTAAAAFFTAPTTKG